MSTRIRVLIVDDEPYVRDSLAEVLRAEGLRVATAAGADEAIQTLARGTFEVIVTDLRMPAGDGAMLLAEARSAGIAIPILVITGAGTVVDAVASMKAGAFDFLQKPVDPDQLVLLVRRAAEHKGLESEVARLRRRIARLEPAHPLVARSNAMQRLALKLDDVAQADGSVLVRGESGSGKERIAAEIHARGPRAASPLVVVDGAALTADTFEHALFGSPLAGPGTLVEADGGILVVDRVESLDDAVQAKLVRVLDSSGIERAHGRRATRIDVRVVALATEELNARLGSGTFRRDLFDRLAVFVVDVPPLRERREDLAGLSDCFLGKTLDAAAIDVLESWNWPGNVRELANVLERASMLAGTQPIDADLLREVLETRVPAKPEVELREFNLRRHLDALERELVLRAIAHTGGKRREAALLMGIDPRNLGYYLRKHKIGEDELGRLTER